MLINKAVTKLTSKCSQTDDKLVLLLMKLGSRETQLAPLIVQIFQNPQ